MNERPVKTLPPTSWRTRVVLPLLCFVILIGENAWRIKMINRLQERVDAIAQANAKIISEDTPPGHQWQTRERWVVDSGYYTKIISSTEAITLEKKEFVFDTYEEALKKLNECEISGCGLDRNLQKFSLTPRDERVLVHIPSLVPVPDGGGGGGGGGKPE